ncbi:MAG TPA: hypothetical protein VGK51_03010 [Actinomycetota bacterium]
MPMPRSKPPTPASAERTTVREEGDLLLVESPTAEEALERLSSLLGPDVEIVAAGKVTRGGIGGFFARELVQLSARSSSRPAPAGAAPTTGPQATLNAPGGPEAPLKAPGGPGERAMTSLLNGTGRPTIAPTAPPPEPPRPATPPAAVEIPTHLRALLARRMAEPAAPSSAALGAEEEPTFGDVLRRQLGIAPPTPPGLGTAPGSAPVSHGAASPVAGQPPSVPVHLAVLDAFWATDGPAPLPEAGPRPETTLPEATRSEATRPEATGPEATGPEAPPAPSETAVAEPAVVLAPLSAVAPPPVVVPPPLPAPRPAPAPELFDPFQETDSLRPGAPPERGDPPATGHPPGTEDPPGTGGVAWSADELVRLGVPFSIIRPLLETDPGDDLAWIRGLAASVHSLCRALPAGDAVLVGARAGHFAEPLRLEALRRPDRGPKRGSICCSMHDDAESRRWLERIRRDRWTHLVVGALDAKAFVDLHPMAVSWVGADALPGALRLATELAVPLGYFRVPEAGPAFRATPIEVALAVRALVARR